jgi:hypothetical protein
LLFFSFSAGAAMATETKQTNGEQANWLINSLTTHCLKISTNGTKAEIHSDGQYTKGTSREKDFTLACGESFNGPTDHHGSSTIKLAGIEKSGLQLSYEMRFDHRSFGKDLITIDSGTVVLPLKSEQPVKASIRKQFEQLRFEIPAAKTISEQNGISIQDAKGDSFTCTRLSAAADKLKIDTQQDAKITLSYMNDQDLKLRFIAASALKKILNTHPNGLSMSDIENKSSPGHTKLIDTFATAINKRFASK